MFKIVWPWLFLLLPLPLLIRWLLPAIKEQLNAGLKVPFYHALESMIRDQGGSPINSYGNLVLAVLIWALLIFAAAGPQWLGKPIGVPRSGRNIMLAIDLSGSMQVNDMTLNDQPANRLQVIKAVAGKFIQERVGDRIGLILFGTRAYLQTPLTFDRKTVLTMLEDATIGLAGTQTAIGDAIGLAIKRLRHYPKQSRVLILLTDGQSNAGVVSPIAAAKVAAKNDVRIYTIGLGSDQQVLSTFFGPQVVNPAVDLDENTLKQIAAITGGLYFRAKDTQSLQKIYKNLNRLEPVESAKTEFRPIKPLYPWPLSLALLLGFYLLERKRSS